MKKNVFAIVLILTMLLAMGAAAPVIGEEYEENEISAPEKNLVAPSALMAAKSAALTGPDCVRRGGNFTLSLQISAKKICGVQLELSYDPLVELLDVTCGGEKWYVKRNGCYIVAYGGEAMGSGESILQLYFQAGENISLDRKVKISAKNMVMTDGKQDIAVSSASWSGAVLPELRGDVDNSGMVSAADLTAFAKALHTSRVPAPAARADMDQNGQMNRQDLLILTRSVSKIKKASN